MKFLIDRYQQCFAELVTFFAYQNSLSNCCEVHQECDHKFFMEPIFKFMRDNVSGAIIVILIMQFVLQ